MVGLPGRCCQVGVGWDVMTGRFRLGDIAW